MGINYLLKVGSDYLGRIPAPAVDILKSYHLLEKRKYSCK